MCHGGTHQKSIDRTAVGAGLSAAATDSGGVAPPTSEPAILG
jgi:hypothetical protein